MTDQDDQTTPETPDLPATAVATEGSVCVCGRPLVVEITYGVIWERTLNGWNPTADPFVVPEITSVTGCTAMGSDGQILPDVEHGDPEPSQEPAPAAEEPETTEGDA